MLVSLMFHCFIKKGMDGRIPTSTSLRCLLAMDYNQGVASYTASMSPVNC